MSGAAVVALGCVGIVAAANEPAEILTQILIGVAAAFFPPTIAAISLGLVLGLMLGYWPLRSSQNNMQEQLNRIEQYLVAQQQSTPAAAPDPHAPAHKGKLK